MRISAKVDYAIRAMAQLAWTSGHEPAKTDDVAQAQDVPAAFLLAILRDLRRARLVRSTRGRRGGYALARPAEQITLADIARAVEGPLANIHETSLHELSYEGAAERLTEVWMAVRTGLRDVLESVTLTDLVSGVLPARIEAMARRYEAEELRRHPGGRRV